MRRPLLVWLALCAGAASFALPASAQLAPQPTDQAIRMLDDPARIATLKIFDVVGKLGLKEGDTVADIGAGTGVFSLPLGQAVKPGKVYAVEVDEGLVKHIGEAAEEQGMRNVVPIYGDYPDPLLPEPVDLAFFNESLHHIEKRAEYLKTLAGYIKPGGRVAIIDFIPGKGDHPDDKTLQVSQADATGWMAAAGFKPVQEVTGLFDDRWFVIYGRQ
jgi:ubiquinone/menaquinone biosynthesis C-methylase UbiE